MYQRILGQKSQYELKPRKASTLHAVMGPILSTNITTVISNNIISGNFDYGFWEAAQVVCLLSHTMYAKDMISNGD